MRYRIEKGDDTRKRLIDQADVKLYKQMYNLIKEQVDYNLYWTFIWQLSDPFLSYNGQICGKVNGISIKSD